MATTIYVVMKAHHYDEVDGTMLFFTHDKTKAQEYCDKKNKMNEEINEYNRMRDVAWENWKKKQPYLPTSYCAGHDFEMTKLRNKLADLKKPDVSLIPEGKRDIVLNNWQKRVDNLKQQINEREITLIGIIDGTNKAHNDKLDKAFEEKYPVKYKDDITYYFTEVSDTIPD